MRTIAGRKNRCPSKYDYGIPEKKVVQPALSNSLCVANILPRGIDGNKQFTPRKFIHRTISVP